MYRLLALLLTVAATAAACSSGETEPRAATDDADLGIPRDREDQQESGGLLTESEEAADPSTDRETPPAIPLDRGEPAADRLAVVDVDGKLATMSPDGSDVVVLAGSDESRISQPGFSPDGTRVVWSELRPQNGAETFLPYLVTSNVDGTDAVDTLTPFLSFYSLWDPTSSRVAFIGNAGNSVALGLAEVGSGVRRAQPVNVGRPYYMSWNPDGQFLLARVGEEFFLVADTGVVTPMAPVTARFRVPIWTPADEMIFPEWNGIAQELFLRGLGENEAPDGLGTYDGEISVVLDPTGRRVAVQVVGDGQLTTIGTADDDGSPSPPLSPGLSIIDLATGAVESVTDEPLVAFFWSPDGEKLLLLAVDEDRSGGSTRMDEIVYAESVLRWDLYTQGSIERFERFTPSFGSVQNLLFFEQYAQSHSFWSTDSDRFVYAGTDDGGQTGIWVRGVDRAEAPELVADGELAIWSPT